MAPIADPAQAACRLIDGAGGTARLAALLGYSRQRIHGWRTSGVPAREVGLVHRVTGVPIPEIRPDIFGCDHGAASSHVSRNGSGNGRVNVRQILTKPPYTDGSP